MTEIEKRVKETFIPIAKEALEIKAIKGTYYGFGSELATLRLLKEYRASGERAEAGYSKNLKRHFFRLEPREFGSFRRSHTLIVMQGKWLHICKDEHSQKPDAWYSIDPSKPIFEEVEKLLVNLGLAHNVVNLEKQRENGESIDYDVIVNTTI